MTYYSKNLFDNTFARIPRAARMVSSGSRSVSFTIAKIAMSDDLFRPWLQ